MRADRSFRVLLIAPSVEGRPRVKDRSLMRETGVETLTLFEGLSLARGEKAFFQRYIPGNKYVPAKGWMTVLSKSA